RGGRPLPPDLYPPDERPAPRADRADAQGPRPPRARPPGRPRLHHVGAAQPPRPPAGARRPGGGAALRRAPDRGRGLSVPPAPAPRGRDSPGAGERDHGYRRRRLTAPRSLLGVSSCPAFPGGANVLAKRELPSAPAGARRLSRSRGLRRSRGFSDRRRDPEIG